MSSENEVLEHRFYTVDDLAPQFRAAALKADPELVHQAVIFHGASAKEKIGCMKHERFRRLVQQLIDAELI